MVDPEKIKQAAKLASHGDWETAFNVLEGKVILRTEYEKIKLELGLEKWIHRFWLYAAIIAGFMTFIFEDGGKFSLNYTLSMSFGGALYATFLSPPIYFLVFLAAKFSRNSNNSVKKILVVSAGSWGLIVLCSIPFAFYYLL